MRDGLGRMLRGDGADSSGDRPGGPAGLRRRIREAPAALRSLVVAQALVSTGNAALSPFLGLYVGDRFGVGIVDASLITSAFFLFGALGCSIGGAAADRIGRRPTVLLALAADAAAVAVLGGAPSLRIALVAIAASGFAGSASYPVLSAVVADTAEPDRRHIAFGVMYQALGLGWFLGPILAAPLLAMAGYPGVMATASLTMAASWLLLWRQLPETRPDAVSSSGGRRERPPAPAAEWWRDPRLLAFVALYLLAFGAYVQLFTVFPIEARARLGLSSQGWAGIMALNGAMILVGQPLVTALVRRVHRPYVVAWGVLGWAVGFTVLGLTGGLGILVPAVAILTLGEMLALPIQPAVVADLAPPGAAGRYQGALTTGGSIGHALAPAVGGVAVATLGPSWWVVVAAGLLVLAAAYVAFGDAIRHPAARPPSCPEDAAAEERR